MEALSNPHYAAYIYVYSENKMMICTKSPVLRNIRDQKGVNQ